MAKENERVREALRARSTEKAIEQNRLERPSEEEQRKFGGVLRNLGKQTRRPRWK